MSKPKNKPSADAISTWEVERKIRKDFGSISPVTRVIPNKKKNPKTKHKGRMYDYD